MGVNKNNNKKTQKRNIFMEKLFYTKFFWISNRNDYTGTIVNKRTLNFRNIYILLWKLVFTQVYPEHRMNGCGQERGILKKRKGYKTISLWKIVFTKIFSEDRINGGTQKWFKKEKLKFIETFLWSRSFLHKFFLEILAMAVQRNDDQEKTSFLH